MIKRTPFFIAIFHPSTLAMLGVTIAGGVCSAWWLAPIGLAMWIVMVILIASEPIHKFNFQLESREPIAGRFQKNFDGINRSHTRLFNTIESAKPRIQRVLQPVMRTATELTDAAYSLCLRLTPIENNRLINQSTGGLLLELENMHRKIDDAEDPVIKSEYEEAYKTIKNRIEDIRSMKVHLERLDAQLISLKNDLDNFQSRVVLLQSRMPKEVDQNISELMEMLNKEINTLKRFDDEINYQST